MEYNLSQAVFDVNIVPKELADCFEPAKCGKCYICHMTGVFEEVRRVLRSDGTLWLNMGDSYCGGGNYRGVNEETLSEKQRSNRGAHGELAIGRTGNPPPTLKVAGLKPKDLCGIPWRLAFALQAAGWWLRCDIIWSKPNPMPSSCEDRPTKSHEYIFLLSKSARYFYDAVAIAEPSSGWHGSKFEDVKNLEIHPDVGKNRANGKWSTEDPQSSGHRITDNVARARANGGEHDSPFGPTRNKRSVWTVPSAPYSGAHFATFPPKLITPCILAGCPAQTCAKCGMPWERVVKKEANPMGINGGEHREVERDGYFFG